MIKTIFALAAFAATCLAMPASAQTPRGKLIINQLSNKCIDVSGAPGVTNGAPLLLWDCERNGKNLGNGSNSDQFWESTSDGQIRNTLSGKCIDIKGRNNGDDLQLWNCERADRNSDQVWVIRNDGFIEHRNTGKCIDVSGAPGTKNGARLQLWNCELNNSGTDQRWRF